MLPKYHIVIGFITSILLFSIFNLTPPQILLIFLSSFLIDIDHYLFFVFRKKSLSLKKAFKWFSDRRIKRIAMPTEEQIKYTNHILIFHGIEFWILLVILANYFTIFWFVLLGFLIHMILDYIELIYIKVPLYLKFSQVMVIIKNKNKIDIS